MSRRPPAVVLMVLAAFSWGLGIVMTKITLERLAPLDVLALELVVGTGVIWAVLLARGLGSTCGWPTFAVLGVLEPGLAFVLGDFGLSKTGASDGALLLASESLFAVVLARMVLSERMSAKVAIAVGVGFGGSVAVGLGATTGQATVVGDLLVLGGSAAAAAYSVGARWVARDQDADALTVTGIQLLVAVGLSVPLVAIGAAGGHSHIAQADAPHLLAGIATGLLTTAAPFLLYNLAIRDLAVASGALILNLIPVISVALAVVLLGEGLGLIQVAGGAAILIAALGTEVATEPVPQA